MDVHADEAEPPPDSSATAVFRQPPARDPAPAGSGRPVTGQNPGTAGQGQLFSDPYPTFADTDKFAALPPRRPPRPPSRTPRRSRRETRVGRPALALRVLVVLVAVLVVGAGVTLGLVKAGVVKIGTPNTPTYAARGPSTSASTTPSTSASSSPSTSTPAKRHTAATAAGAPLLTQVSTGSGTATYQIGVVAYAVTVKTSVARVWVRMAINGHTPAFAGIVAPNSSQKQTLSGPSQVEVGAGGTTVVVTSGTHSQTLTPPSAPFTYHFEPTS